MNISSASRSPPLADGLTVDDSGSATPVMRTPSIASMSIPDGVAMRAVSPVPSASSSRYERDAVGSTSGVSATRTARDAAGSAKAKRNAEDKRRREEAELRVLIQREMEAARLLHARILQNEAQLATAAKQLDKQTESTETERKGLQGELRKWEKRLAQRKDTVAERRAELESLDQRIAYLRSQRNVQKICLSSLFLRYDMKPDVAVQPEDIFTHGSSRSGGGGSASPHYHRQRSASLRAAAAAAPLSRDMLLSATSVMGGDSTGQDDDAEASPSPDRPGGFAGGRRRSRALSRTLVAGGGGGGGGGAGTGRRSSVVVQELEIEPGLEYLRPKLSQIQHEAFARRSQNAAAARGELTDLYMQIAALENGRTSPFHAVPEDETPSTVEVFLNGLGGE